jgi:biotin transporter BioY
VKWYREGELYNGRWAMAAVAGILFTDALGLPKFWEAGAEVSSGPFGGAVWWWLLAELSLNLSASRARVCD